MARSSYIYIVSIASFPVAAFTVKHELSTWLKNQEAPQECRIMRLPDGGRPKTIIQYFAPGEITGETYPAPSWTKLAPPSPPREPDDTPPY